MHRKYKTQNVEISNPLKIQLKWFMKNNKDCWNQSFAQTHKGNLFLYEKIVELLQILLINFTQAGEAAVRSASSPSVKQTYNKMFLQNYFWNELLQILSVKNIYRLAL